MTYIRSRSRRQGLASCMSSSNRHKRGRTHNPSRTAYHAHNGRTARSYQPDTVPIDSNIQEMTQVQEPSQQNVNKVDSFTSGNRLLFVVCYLSSALCRLLSNRADDVYVNIPLTIPSSCRSQLSS